MTGSLAESLGSGHSSEGWARDFLAGIGAPRSKGNIAFVEKWESLESGGGGGSYNPLNSTLGAPGATDLNGVGVKNYVSYAQGLAASVATFTETQWAGVIAGLKADDQQAAADAINSEYATWHGGPLDFAGTPGTNVVGNGNPGTGSSSSSGAGTVTETCILKLPGTKIAFFHLGGGCLLHSNQGRALLGAFCLTAGLGVMLIGLGFVAVGGKNPLASVAPLLAAAA